MKKRLIILISSIVVIFAFFSISFFMEQQFATNLLAVSLIALTFLSVYIFWSWKTCYFINLWNDSSFNVSVTA